MSDTSCIFCKIANGEIPSATIYEDDNFRVILDSGTCFEGPRIDSSQGTLCKCI